MDLNFAINFLLELRENNDRNWFNKNKTLYKEARKEFEQLIDMVIPIIKGIDSEIDVTCSKECIFRIYRDVRFSRSKLPYKTNFGAFIVKDGRKSPFPGYYIHLEPNASFVGGGVYMPESKYLKAVRTEIYENIENYKKIINSKNFKKYFNGIYGDKLKSAPRDFPKDFVDIDLLKNKHYATVHKVADSFWNSEKLIEELTKILKSQFVFNEFINKAIKKEIIQ